MKAGRPKGPEKVVYKRRVLPEMVSRLDLFLSGDAIPLDCSHSEPVVGMSTATHEIEGLKNDLKRLLESAESDAKTIAELNALVTYWRDMAPNARIVYWMNRCSDLERAIKERYDNQA